jgi:hypothetical protein
MFLFVIGVVHYRGLIMALSAFARAKARFFPPAKSDFGHTCQCFAADNRGPIGASFALTHSDKRPKIENWPTVRNSLAGFNL